VGERSGGGGSSGRPRRTTVFAGWWVMGEAEAAVRVGTTGRGTRVRFIIFFVIIFCFLCVSHSAIIIVVISRRHRSVLAFLSGSHRSGRAREQRV